MFQDAGLHRSAANECKAESVSSSLFERLCLIYMFTFICCHFSLRIIIQVVLAAAICFQFSATHFPFSLPFTRVIRRFSWRSLPIFFRVCSIGAAHMTEMCPSCTPEFCQKIPHFIFMSSPFLFNHFFLRISFRVLLFILRWQVCFSTKLYVSQS